MKQLTHVQAGNAGTVFDSYRNELSAARADITVATRTEHAATAKKALAAAISRLTRARRLAPSAFEVSARAKDRQTPLFPLIASIRLRQQEGAQIAQFFDDSFTVERGSDVTEAEVYQSYELWCAGKGVPCTLFRHQLVPVFRAHVVEKGCRPARNVQRDGKNQRGFRGIASGATKEY